ncbi:MAG TPA: hypothetical protein VKB57_00240 [Acidimicrobiales bacterium]|nr:hypothetical protein [Acidimicrobiales bacterium]
MFALRPELVRHWDLRVQLDVDPVARADVVIDNTRLDRPRLVSAPPG